MRSVIIYATMLLLVISIAGCGSSRSMAYVIINNESSSHKPVNMSISVAGKNNQHEIIRQADINPGLQQITARKYKKGAYSIIVQANNGLVSIKQPLALDADRWIMITYTHGDSVTISRKYGYVDTSLLKRVDGKYASIDMYVENRRPPNL